MLQVSTIGVESLVSSNPGNPKFIELFEVINRLRRLWEEEVRRIEHDFMMQSPFEAGKAYFEKNKEALIQQYEGKYIAIWNDEVIDSDALFSLLAKRVCGKLGYVSIYMPFVIRKRRVLHFNSPRFFRVNRMKL